MIHVCPLSRLHETVALSGATRVVSLLTAGTEIIRPPSVAETDHLLLSINDIAEHRDGMTLPGEAHIRSLLDFAGQWDRSAPLVIHCYAGISRSPASAYIIAAALAPERDEAELAATLRALSPSATPNPKLIAIADGLLGRNGRMIVAIANIGRGADAFESAPFMLSIDA